jgi:hypothetical protein
MEAPGFATSQGQFKKLARTRAFLVKLLMGATFDVFIDSSPFFEVPPESTQFCGGILEASGTCSRNRTSKLATLPGGLTEPSAGVSALG